MQPFSFHCCHKYTRKKNDDKIYYTSNANKEPTEMKWIYKKYEKHTHTHTDLKPHNDGSKRAVGNKRTTKQTEEMKRLDWERAYMQRSVLYVFIAWTLVCSVLVSVCEWVSEYISQLTQLYIHQNMIDELWFHIHNPLTTQSTQWNKGKTSCNNKTDGRQEQPRTENGWN